MLLLLQQLFSKRQVVNRSLVLWYFWRANHTSKRVKNQPPASASRGKVRIIIPTRPVRVLRRWLEDNGSASYSYSHWKVLFKCQKSRYWRYQTKVPNHIFQLIKTKQLVECSRQLTPSVPHESIPDLIPSSCRCHRQISRYICPSCNVPYCSLTCFRSDAHTQCSEPFYKRELEDGIKSQPNASTAERVKMMELLKRFEEEEGDGELEGLEDDGADAETDGLAQRLAGIDLGVSPYS